MTITFRHLIATLPLAQGGDVHMRSPGAVM
jgi:hypothetical protein